MAFNEKIDGQQITFASNMLTFALICSKRLVIENRTQMADKLYNINRKTLSDVFNAPKSACQTTQKQGTPNAPCLNFNSNRANTVRPPKKMELTKAPSELLSPSEQIELSKMETILEAIAEGFLQLTPQQQNQVLASLYNPIGKIYKCGENEEMLEPEVDTCTEEEYDLDDCKEEYVEEQETNCKSPGPADIDKMDKILESIVENFLELSQDEQAELITCLDVPADDENQNCQEKKPEIQGDEDEECEEGESDESLMIEIEITPSSTPNRRFRPSGNASQRAAETIQRILEKIRASSESRGTSTCSTVASSSEQTPPWEIALCY